MPPWIYALTAGVIISLIGFVGLAGLLVSQRLLRDWLSAIVAFAAGSLLGGAFLHLLPEAAEGGGNPFILALLGLVVFFILDSVFWVYHCHGGHQFHDHEHTGSCPTKPVGYLNLVADALHNFTDGIIIGSAFLVSVPLGITTSIAIALHEIPQEMSDFGILLYSGFTRKKAVIMNVLVACVALLGIGFVFLLQASAERITTYTIPLAAGGFIYMACTNLLSEIKEEESIKRRAWQFLLLIAGVGLMWLLRD